MSQNEDSQPRRGQSLGNVFRSVAASMFGVQSRKQHEEDFGQGSISTYIMVGFVATVLFVLSVWGIVQLVVRVAAP